MSTRVACAVVLLGVASLLLPLLPDDGSRDALQTAIQMACLAIAWHHVLQRRILMRLGWGMTVLAVTVLALSDVVAALERHLSNLAVRPAPSNVLALVGYLLLGLAVYRLDRNRNRSRQLPGGIEAAIFATGVLTPILVFLILPVMHQTGLTVGARLVTIAYALADLVVVTVAARLLLIDGRQSRSFAYLSASLFVVLAGDVWSSVTLEAGSSGVPPMVKVLWLLGYVLFAAGIAHPSMENYTSGDARAPDAPRHRRVWLMGLGQAMPALALMVCWLLGRTSSMLVIGVGGLLVSLLVSARMNGLLDRISAQTVQLADLARSDELTGLHNRRSWNYELARACAAASATGEPLSVALLDLDHFKAYNDSYGHPAGDRLLRAASEAWQAALRPGEVLARYGGEEFAVLMPGTPLDAAVLRVDELRLLTPDGQSVSGGVAPWVDGGEPEQSVADADVALYQAKRSGRGRVLPFHVKNEASAQQLPHGRVLTQPIVRAQDGVSEPSTT